MHAELVDLVHAELVDLVHAELVDLVHAELVDLVHAELVDLVHAELVDLVHAERVDRPRAVDSLMIVCDTLLGQTPSGGARRSPGAPADEGLFDFYSGEVGPESGDEHSRPALLEKEPAAPLGPARQKSAPTAGPPSAVSPSKLVSESSSADS